MLKSNFPQWLEQLHCQALEQYQRQLVLLIGDACWVKQLLQLDNNDSNNQCLVYSQHADIASTIDNKHFAQQLGSEHKRILFSCHENNLGSAHETVNLDALAALSGTLVAGGVMFLWLVQPLKQAIANSELLSLKYFYQQLLNNKELITLEQSSGQPFPLLPSSSIDVQATLTNFSYLCKTQEQQTAVEHIIKVSQGHRNRPLVLTADRGRGKSSALAIACLELLEKNHGQGKEPLAIVITAPHIRSLSVFYRQLTLSLTELGVEFNYTNASKTAIQHCYGSITFVAVDQLIHHTDALNVSLLLVDEAAAIPVPLLTELASRYSRVVFSSTVHGYEGAGRGFTVKFQQKLKQLSPQWRSFHIHQPIRWRSEDPLERFVFECCLLNAKLAKLPILANAETQCRTKASLTFSKISAKALLEDKLLLQDVVAVLVTAHYQTSPNDITLLFDNRSAHIFIAKLAGDIVGVAVLLEEGGKTQADIEAIASNQRRLKNQFIPQSLMTHCGFSESFQYQYLRVLRIAIHPQYQGFSFGESFIRQLKLFAKDQQVDFIGASFGANAQLLKFWQGAGFQVARVGFTKDQASGEHSALVISAMSDRAQFFERKVNHEFYNSFDYLLTDEYKHLSPQLVWQILHHCPESSLPKLTAHQTISISDFTQRKRQYSHCVRSLHFWCLLHCKAAYHPDILILIERILQKKTLDEVCANHQLTGKKMLNKVLIDFISQHQ